MEYLAGKKAIVTSAARGLGEAILEHLAEEGVNVVAWDIEGQPAKMAEKVAS